MFQHHRFVPALLCGLIIAAIFPLLSAQTRSGEWTLSRSDKQGKVRFTLQSSKDGDHFNTSSDWNASDFRGMDWSSSGKHDVHFTITRDAGSIECEGFLKNGEGAGLFTFNSNSAYRSEMQSLGFSGVSSDKQLAFAIHDVSLAFARQMKSLGIQGLDTDKLMAFRIHGVSPAYVRELQRLGYSHPDADQLITMRIHGVTPEYIENLRSHGMHDLTLDQLVSLRIQGIN
jgi:hypothetical protein